ncbi:hypothetical protein HHI36_011664 [Cryptolaemus montrouzieri]|uniref:Palmitoyltransferase n=1 Tax=Cryptolaemus montrouzieri TaxID=559131 RepID=A0ABD2MMS2_9CUCU
MKNENRHNAMPCCRKCLQSIPSVLLIILILFTYYTYLVEFCFMELKNQRIRQILYLIVGNCLFCMFTWCYIHVMCCKANFNIPLEYKLSYVEHNRLLNLSAPKQSEVLENYAQNRHIILWLRTSDNLIRYCMKCRQIKPDRTHHCSACATCVLKMDHHCPWTNNCIGFANQKSFILMLMYGTLACLFYTIILIEYYLHLGIIKPDLHTGFLCSGFASSLMFVMGQGAMLQEKSIDLLRKNETQLETFQRKQQRVHFEDPRLSFNLGCEENFLDCFGRNAWNWFIPKNSACGNGVTFKIRPKKNKSVSV